MVTVVLAGKGARMETEDSSREVGLQQARSYLRNADPVLARLIDDRPDFDLAEARLDNPFGLVLPMDLFGALLFQITGQQLSIPATRPPRLPPSPARRGGPSRWRARHAPGAERTPVRGAGTLNRPRRQGHATRTGASSAPKV